MRSRIAFPFSLKFSYSVGCYEGAHRNTCLQMGEIHLASAFEVQGRTICPVSS